MSVRKWIQVIAVLLLMICAGYIVSNIPAQELKITAMTKTEEPDMSGTTDIYYFKSLDAGSTYTASISFQAVSNTSDSLFTTHGSGQTVYLGCGELTTGCEFISVGRFVCVRLTLEAAQTDLRLEDGTPFDITRYSLKPILTIEE